MVKPQCSGLHICVFPGSGAVGQSGRAPEESTGYGGQRATIEAAGCYTGFDAAIRRIPLHDGANRCKW